MGYKFLFFAFCAITLWLIHYSELAPFFNQAFIRIAFSSTVYENQESREEQGEGKLSGVQGRKTGGVGGEGLQAQARLVQAVDGGGATTTPLPGVNEHEMLFPAGCV